MAMVDESRLEDDSVLLLLQSERYLGPHPFSLDLDLLWDEAREGLRTSRRELEETLRDLPEDDYSRHAPFNWEQVIEAKRSDIVPGVKTEELDRIAGQIEIKLASMELPGDLRRHASRIADSVKQYRALSIRLTEIAEVAKRPEREAGTTIGELRTLAKDYDSILRLQFSDKPSTPTPHVAAADADAVAVAGRRIEGRLKELRSEYRKQRDDLIEDLKKAASQDERFAALLLRWNGVRDDVLVQIRERMLGAVAGEVTRRLGPVYDLKVEHLPVGGLARARDPNNYNPYPTEVYSHLDRLIALRDRASIGLSGPRGAGKSTLIRYACRLGLQKGDKRESKFQAGSDMSYSRSSRTHYSSAEATEATTKPRFGIVLSAPTSYEPKEFILLLHKRLCQALSGSASSWSPANEQSPKADWAGWFRRQIVAGWYGRQIVASGLVAAGFTLAILAPLQKRNIPASIPAEVGQALMLAGVVVLTAAAFRLRRLCLKWADALAGEGMRGEAGERLAEFYPSWRRLTQGSVSGLSTAAAAFASGLILSITSDGFARTLPFLVASCLIVGAVLAVLVRPLRPLPPGGYLRPDDEDRQNRRYSVSFWPQKADDHPILEKEAAAQLQQLQYTTSYTADSSATIKAGSTSSIPIGLEAKRGRGVNRQPVSLTYPEIVARLRDLLYTVRDMYEVVIGIDELDKMRKREDVESFLNEIKTIFDIPGCYFLVSVSEDAAAGFERRGAAFRDVFDSSFDDVLTLPYLTFKESGELLLNSAGGRWPAPLLMLCHVMAGGLPRDLLRMARQVVQLADGGGIDGAEAARRLVKQDITDRCHAVQHEVRKKIDAAPARARALYPRIPSWTFAEVNPAVLRAAGEALLDGEGPDRPTSVEEAPLDSLAAELAAAHSLDAELLNFFVDGYSIERMKEAESSQQIDVLADARRNIGLDPRLAKGQIADLVDARRERAADK